MDGKHRIKLDMSTHEVALVMSKGNAGALTVLIKMFNLDKFMEVLRLDEKNIYEDRIWILYKDVCGQDVQKMVDLLHSNQMGLISDESLNHAIDNYSVYDKELNNKQEGGD